MRIKETKEEAMGLPAMQAAIGVDHTNKLEAGGIDWASAWDARRPDTIRPERQEQKKATTPQSCTPLSLIRAVPVPSELTIEAPAVIRHEGPKITWKEARRFMGENFFGVEAVLKTFGGKIENYGDLGRILESPYFPFTKQELERHRLLGGFVIVRPNRIPVTNDVFFRRYESSDATMSVMHEQLNYIRKNLGAPGEAGAFQPVQVRPK